MKISEAMAICHKNGIKIYGYKFKKKHKNWGKYNVEVEENEILKKSKILHDSNKELNIAVTKIKNKEPLLRINGILDFQVIHEEETWPPFLLSTKYENQIIQE